MSITTPAGAMKTDALLRLYARPTVEGRAEEARWSIPSRDLSRFRAPAIQPVDLEVTVHEKPRGGVAITAVCRMAEPFRDAEQERGR